MNKGLILGLIKGKRDSWRVNISNDLIIRWKFVFLFIGRDPTTWPANNCQQIMFSSCAMSSNFVWLQIIFCSCVNDTTLFSFLRSLLRENGRSLRFLKIFLKKQTRWSNDNSIYHHFHYVMRLSLCQHHHHHYYQSQPTSIVEVYIQLFPDDYHHDCLGDW